MDDRTEKALTGRADDMLGQIGDFNRSVVGMPIPPVPTRLDPERKEWAMSALTEELTEFRDATTLDEELDALVDLTYFALGRIVEMGIAPGGPFGEVQRANMEKRRGELSKRPGSKGFDAVKPPGWRGPDHADFLSLATADVAMLIALKRGHAYRLNGVTYSPLTEEQFQLVNEHGAMRLGQRKPRLLIMGHARHGKDTVCELLRDDYGYRFMSSSMFCAERVVLPAARASDRMPFYANAVQCFEDRAHHRKFWFDAITAYNTPDKSRLGREIFESFDVYCGIRNAEEFEALKLARAFDFAIWVDASERAPSEGTDSCTVTPNMADYVLDNNGPVEDLPAKLDAFMKGIIS